MDSNLQSPLTAVAVKSTDGNDHVILVCDSESRQFYVVNSANGKTVTKFRTKKTLLNENYQRILCQLEEERDKPKFVLTNSQYIGSTKNDLRMCQLGTLVQGFHDELCQEIILSVLPYSLITTANAVICWNRIVEPRKYRIFVINTKNLCDRIEYYYEEPQQFFGIYPFYIAADTIERQDQKSTLPAVVYLHSAQMDQMAVVQLDDTLKVERERHQPTETKILWKNIQPDEANGYPLKTSLSLRLSTQLRNKVFFVERQPNQASCSSLWALIFNWHQDEYRWSKIRLNKEVLMSDNAILISNTFEELFIVDKNGDQQECTATKLCSLNTHSLKYLAGKAVLNVYHPLSLVAQSNHLNLPKSCNLFGLFGYFEKAKKVHSFTDDEQRSVVICMLTENQLESFCKKRLSFRDGTMDQIESVRAENTNKLVVKFKTLENKTDFLSLAKLAEDDRYTAQIVEIYDYCSAYMENIEPIFISIPWDTIL